MKTTVARLIRPSVAGSIRLAVVLLMGFGALVLPVGVVHAGAPSLTASENPVVIPFGQSSGQFMLSWNSGNGAAVELWGSHNGGPDVGPYPAPAVGSSPETIAYGETILFKLYTPNKAQLLTSLKETTTRPLVAETTCSQQCIKSVNVDPHGTFADFHIVTTAPVKVTLEAHEDGKPTASATFNLSQAPDWQTYLLDLKPNTKYIYNVKAWDSSNNTQYKSGSFTTLRRQVTVTITDVHVISEDDEDMHFFFNVNNFWDTGTCYPDGPTFDSCPIAKINAGETVHPNYTKVAIDVGDTLTVMVQGVEDNCSGVTFLPIPYVSLCTNGLGLDKDQLNGSANDTVWATAVGQIAIGSGNLHDEVYNDTFTITSPAADYRFSASGTIKVDYVK